MPEMLAAELKWDYGACGPGVGYLHMVGDDGPGQVVLISHYSDPLGSTVRIWKRLEDNDKQELWSAQVSVKYPFLWTY